MDYSEGRILTNTLQSLAVACASYLTLLECDCYHPPLKPLRLELAVKVRFFISFNSSPGTVRYLSVPVPE